MGERRRLCRDGNGLRIRAFDDWWECRGRQAVTSQARRLLRSPSLPPADGLKHAPDRRRTGVFESWLDVRAGRRVLSAPDLLVATMQRVDLDVPEWLVAIALEPEKLSGDPGSSILLASSQT